MLLLLKNIIIKKTIQKCILLILSDKILIINFDIFYLLHVAFFFSGLHKNTFLSYSNMEQYKFLVLKYFYILRDLFLLLFSQVIFMF